ncbi:hypothetical protein GCM10023215_31240 [Pseudonocardia yuanmonensis]|uniref:Uncharacterized protein n=1 Tax=Pseudonocardia yuanmonensis TaxID=1095914 RepID=A0ABP8WNN2_9PSEU
MPATVREENRLNCWKIIPTSARSARSPRSPSVPVSRPATVTVPAVGSSSALTMRTNVLLPAPE